MTDQQIEKVFLTQEMGEYLILGASSPPLGPAAARRGTNGPIGCSAALDTPGGI
jgi:hypothetical protein